jgi:hypothetical protein
MKKYVLLALFAVAVVALIGASQVWKKVAPPELTFTQECLADGNMWHSMTPLRNGIGLPGEERPGCMTANGMHHFADAAEYRAAKNPGESDAVIAKEQIGEGKLYRLRFTLTGADGAPPELYQEHERYLHVIIVSADMRHFAHVHPEEQEGFDSAAITRGVFDLEYEFPTAGEYIVAVDYANKLKHESRQFRVTAEGSPMQGETATYPHTGRFDGYEVSLDARQPVAGEVANLTFDITKDGRRVTGLQPYLGAAMHVAIAKDDLSAFVHTHGEIHPPGYVPPPAGTPHIHTPPPTSFSPPIDAHPVFPSPGVYTVFAEFKHEGKVVRPRFTVRVE